MTSDTIRDNLDRVRSRMADAARRSGRDPATIRLVAVTKRQPPERVQILVDLGILDLAENYPQELWGKVEALPDPAIRWHLIGHLQSNKAKRTLPLVRVVHGVDSLRLYEVVEDLNAGHADPPSICLQVNASGEEAKRGWTPEDLLREVDSIVDPARRATPIIGLMTMAGYGTTDEEARPAFARVRELRDQIQARTGVSLPELSMGMSGDFEAAIEEGATMIRVGSALFEGLDE